jgi:hypothetical protein
VVDNTNEICVPSDLCTPAHCVQMKHPSLTDAQLGSSAVQSAQTLLSARFITAGKSSPSFRVDRGAERRNAGFTLRENMSVVDFICTDVHPEKFRALELGREFGTWVLGGSDKLSSGLGGEAEDSFVCSCCEDCDGAPLFKFKLGAGCIL